VWSWGAVSLFACATSACDAAYESPSGEKYTLEEDIPLNHVTLKGPMIPRYKQSNVYDYFFDIKEGKFKLWDTIVDTSPIPDDVEVLANSFFGCVADVFCADIIAHGHSSP
jgi:hypothetical protein